jgi:uncharacterized damage-inducible protein DinB
MPMTLKELLVNHLTYTFEREAWQPSLSESVEGLTAPQAAWKPAPERHSIWQIVRHIILWKQSLLDAWDGRAGDFKALEAQDWREASGDDQAWHADVRRLREVSTEIKRRIEALDETGVEQSIPTYAGLRDRPLAHRVMHAATHDSYHAGQIRYIRAMQGAQKQQ